LSFTDNNGPSWGSTWQTGNASSQFISFYINSVLNGQVDATGVTVGNAAGPSILNEAATATNPTIIPHKGSLTTGIGSQTAGVISLIAGGTEGFRVTSTYITGVVANAPIMKNETPTATNPVFAPSAGDPNTGMGWVSADIGSLVAGGVEALRWANGTVTITGAVAGNAVALQAEMETGTAVDSIVSPGRQGFHPSAPKAWVRTSGTAVTVVDSFNMSSVTDSGVGLYAPQINNNMGDGDYAVTTGADDKQDGGGIFVHNINDAVAQATTGYGTTFKKYPYALTDANQNAVSTVLGDLA
jgi:hypothetical protein